MSVESRSSPLGKSEGNFFWESEETTTAWIRHLRSNTMKRLEGGKTGGRELKSKFQLQSRESPAKLYTTSKGMEHSSSPCRLVTWYEYRRPVETGIRGTS